MIAAPLRTLPLLATALLLCGCAQSGGSMGYYWQSLRGHLALDSGLRLDPQSQSLYLHEPRLTRLDLPQVPGAPEPQQLLAIGDELLAEYARAQPVYVLSERRQAQVPLGRSIYRVDIEDGRLVIGVSR